MGRFIDSGGCRPHWNMAVDQALLDLASGGVTLRFYAWNPPGLSIGYFQHASKEELDSAVAAGYVPTRRLTGGGAILHSGDLTYSLVSPKPAGGNRELYSLANRAIISALAALGAHASERGGRLSGLGFLCFDRLADFDVVVGGSKVAGSAQRRKGRMVLQHGSIVLAAPRPLAGPRSPSPLEPLGISYGPLAQALRESFEREIGAGLDASDLTEAEKDRAEELESGRYSSPGWICMR